MKASQQTKKMRKYKVKTLRSNIIPPHKNKIMYTVEPIDAKTLDPTISGDVYKKYKNGKLVKQVFVSKNKFREITDKLTPRFLKFGGSKKTPTHSKKNVTTPIEVVVSPNTGLGHYMSVLKNSGVAALGFTIVNWITVNVLEYIFKGGEE
jgi:hypothetical protein